MLLFGQCHHKRHNGHDGAQRADGERECRWNRPRGTSLGGVRFHINHIVLLQVEVGRCYHVLVVEAKALCGARSVGISANHQYIVAFTLNCEVSGHGNGLEQIKSLIGHRYHTGL